MTSYRLVDPELRDALQFFPKIDATAEGVQVRRDKLNAMLESDAQHKAMENVEVRHIAHEGAPDVRILIHRPFQAISPLPAICHVHGGGFISGSAEMMAISHQRIVKELNCIIVSVDYRLPPDVQHPGPIEDCYAALRWMFDNSEDLGIDRQRIGIAGESAGGGLAASLTLLARDRGEIPIAFQHLLCPMLDDRTCTTSTPHLYTGEYIWTREDNAFGWAALLGTAPGGDDVSYYASPARATDLSGLPPTFISTSTLDLFLDEDVDYALRLTRAGVPVELHVYPGGYHGFHLNEEARVTLKANRDSKEALDRFLNGYQQF